MVNIVVPASLVFLIAIGAVATTTPAPVIQSKKADPAKELYMSNCQMCHGPDGRSAIKDMSFVGRQWKTKTTAEAIKVITKGVPGTVMLPFEGKLTKEQISALAKYVRSLDTPQARKKKDSEQAPSVEVPVPAALNAP